jgi:hypothetical protein
MKIALYGATGMVGQRVLAEAVSRGHEVTAIARDPSKVAANNGHVKATRGDLFDPNSVAQAVKGHDAVVSAFGPGADQPVETVEKSVRSLISGARSAGVKRLVVVGGAGSLETRPGVTVLDEPWFPESYHPIAIAHRDALETMRREASDLEWTNFSPAALIAPGERTGKFRIETDKLVVNEQGESRISAEDYAAALVDELERPKHVGRRFTAAY